MANNELGNRLRQRRRAILPTVSIKAVAKQAGLTQLGVAKIERGVSQNPHVETVAAIEGALEFFEDAECADRKEKKT